MQPNRSPSWFSRNWKWAVPAGCLTLIVAFLAVAIGAVFFVFGLMKSSDVYREALAEASSHAAVVEALGEPVEAGWYLMGNIEVNDGSGRADISIPISGPKGSGTIFAVATKSAARWSYEILEVELGAGERIDLLSPTTQ